MENRTDNQEKLFTTELQIVATNKLLIDNPHLTLEESRQALRSMVKNYEDLLDQTKFLTRISDRLEQRMNSLNFVLKEKNIKLEQALAELTEAQRSRRTYLIIYLMATTLFVFEEVIVDPVVKIFETSMAVVMAWKLLVALLLKPAESILQKMLIRRPPAYAQSLEMQIKRWKAT